MGELVWQVAVAKRSMGNPDVVSEICFRMRQGKLTRSTSRGINSTEQYRMTLFPDVVSEILLPDEARKVDTFDELWNKQYGIEPDDPENSDPRKSVIGGKLSDRL